MRERESKFGLRDKVRQNEKAKVIARKKETFLTEREGEQCVSETEKRERIVK